MIDDPTDDGHDCPTCGAALVPEFLGEGFELVWHCSSGPIAVTGDPFGHEDQRHSDTTLLAIIGTMTPEAPTGEDLHAAIPPVEPAEDALVLAGRALVSSIPVVGGIAAEVISFGIDARNAERRRRFDVLVVQALQSNSDRLDNAVTPESVLASDEFLAAFNRAIRLADETASETKRARLAAAVAASVFQTDRSSDERSAFMRLVEKYDDLHIWLLRLFTDASAHLTGDEPCFPSLNSMGGSFRQLINCASGVDNYSSDVDIAMKALEQEALLPNLNLDRVLTGSGLFDPRISERGTRFLDYLGEPPAAV